MAADRAFASERACPSLALRLGPFFRNQLAKQRNASPLDHRQLPRRPTHADPLRRRSAPSTSRVQAVKDLDRDLVSRFSGQADELEQKRKNAIQTGNARLTAIRSFFRHVAANDPAPLGIAQRVPTIPVKKSHTEVTHYLSRYELTVLIDAPDQQTPGVPVSATMESFSAIDGDPKMRRMLPAILLLLLCGCAASKNKNYPGLFGQKVIGNEQCCQSYLNPQTSQCWRNRTYPSSAPATLRPATDAMDVQRYRDRPPRQPKTVES
jgi:hypothetical protein